MSHKNLNLTLHGFILLHFQGEKTIHEIILLTCRIDMT